MIEENIDVNVAETAEIVIEGGALEELERPSRKAWKPDISKLPVAFLDGKFLAKAGDFIVIQYPDNWRDTCVWKIVRVDESSGNVLMVIPNAAYHGMTNFVTGPERGQEIRLYNPKIRLEVYKQERKEKPVPKPVYDANGNEVKRKRGRPKGVKNKATIEKEEAIAKGELVPQSVTVQRNGRGRPKLSEEEKAIRLAEREAARQAKIELRKHRKEPVMDAVPASR